MSRSAAQSGLRVALPLDAPHGVPEHLSELSDDELNARLQAACDSYFAAYPPPVRGVADDALEVWVLEEAQRRGLVVNGMTLPRVWSLLRHGEGAQ